MAKILVIDDDQQILDLISMDLTMDGHEITIAQSGKEGVAIFERERFDLIMTDIVMPNGHGIYVITYIREKAPHLPIIAMSGGRRRVIDTQFNLEAAATMGFTKTLEKPFTAVQLRSVIQKILNGL